MAIFGGTVPGSFLVVALMSMWLVASCGGRSVQPGDSIELDASVRDTMSVHCGVEWLGTLNGVTWRTAVPDGVIDWVPPAWQQVVGPDETLILEIELSPGPDPTVVAMANGHAEIYRPAQEPPPGFD